MKSGRIVAGVSSHLTEKLGYEFDYEYTAYEVPDEDWKIAVRKIAQNIKLFLKEEMRMFRKMRRFKQQISGEECIRILKEQPRGVLSMLGDDGYPYQGRSIYCHTLPWVLSMLGDDGYPYGIPLDHWYSEDDNKLYFHCAKAGHKLDAIAACDKVSYCVMDDGYRKEGEWALNINSVVVFGRIRIIDDEEKKREICTNIVRKFTDDEEYLQKELTNAFPRVNCLELTIEHMTGKLVNES